MPKSSSVFVCQNCGYESAKWLGQCPECGAWNTFEEQVKPVAAGKRTAGSSRPALSAQTVKLSEVQAYDQSFRRIGTGMEEFDRVLGGGMVLGSIVLIGGEPGIGKSTLLTQLMLNLAKGKVSGPILYAAGEESPEQIKLRIDRMSGENNQANWQDAITFVTSTDADEIVATAEGMKPSLLIIDSIQTMTTSLLTGTAGSIGQLKECTERFTRYAKTNQVPTFLVGHVTKEGTIAGPKVLEHVVDAVLELSGERTGQFRLLRAIKNRFGATDEVGVFQIVETGLQEISNPSQVFLEERQEGVPGSALACVIEGTRPILVEVQALVVPSQLAMPRRVARGISLPRVQLIAAVLQKHCHLPLGTCDIFVNVAGGFSVNEPAIDLAVAVAIASSERGSAVKGSSVCIGEVGLLGEVRRVSLMDKRVKEAKRLGYQTVISAAEYTSIARVLSASLPHSS